MNDSYGRALRPSKMGFDLRDILHGPRTSVARDGDIAASFLGAAARRNVREPDLIIAPDGKPYIYRWHLVPRNKHANVYFHIQVADDPERPLHDHPWDNTSYILAGGYSEIYWPEPPHGDNQVRWLKPGNIVHRKAKEAHRLLMPRDGNALPYSMSLFTTGPKVRDWGFWSLAYPDNPIWLSHKTCIRTSADGQSTYQGPKE